jgi:hypothetical protein
MPTSHLCFVQAKWSSLSLLVALCTVDELSFKAVSNGLTLLPVGGRLDVCNKPCRLQKDFNPKNRGMLLIVRHLA